MCRHDFRSEQTVTAKKAASAKDMNGLLFESAAVRQLRRLVI